jgi:hypothetical protein
VLELEDLEDGAVDLDVVAVLELVGADHGVSGSGYFEARGRSRSRRLDAPAPVG